MHIAPTSNPDLQDLAKTVRQAKFAMVTTLERDGSLHSRPLTTLAIDEDGVLWFAIDIETDPARAISAATEPRVNLAYVENAHGKFLSVAGRATLVQDAARARALWSPMFKPWFHGPDDPRLALLRVEPEHATLWDSPDGTVQRTFALAKAVLTGDRGSLGEKRTLEVGATSHRG